MLYRYNPCMISSRDCVFCDIIDGRARPAGPQRSVLRYPGVVAFVPRDPVTPGHVLVVPNAHIADAADDPEIAGHVMEVAALHARHTMGSFNIITSAGEAATQSVYHLHLHIVPRRAGDGLMLPWSAQQAEKMRPRKTFDRGKLASYLVAEAETRGLTIEQLLDAMLREEQAYQDGWRECEESRIDPGTLYLPRTLEEGVRNILQARLEAMGMKVVVTDAPKQPVQTSAEHPNDRVRIDEARAYEDQVAEFMAKIPPRGKR